jgi:hypothetical protein
MMLTHLPHPSRGLRKKTSIGQRAAQSLPARDHLRGQFSLIGEQV